MFSVLSLEHEQLGVAGIKGTGLPSEIVVVSCYEMEVSAPS
jgi:hypothetical protein